MAKDRLIRGRTVLLFLLIFVVVLSAAVLLLRENISSMLRALGRANYLFAAAALLTYTIGLALWSLRWHVTLSAVGHPIQVRSLYVIIFGGIFINNVTPFTYSGGDPIARSYILKKTKMVPYTHGFATIGTEFILDIPVYVSLLAMGVMLSTQGAAIWFFPLVVGLWVAFVIGWSFFFTRVISSTVGACRISRLISKVGNVFHRRINHAKIEHNIRNFYSISHQIIKNKTVVARVVAITVFLWILAIFRLFLIFLALGFAPPLHMLLFAVTLPALVGMIPLLPGGLGTVDATITSVFLVFGAPLDIAISATLIERAITLVFSTLVGGVAISHLGVKHGRVTEQKAKRMAK